MKRIGIVLFVLFALTILGSPGGAALAQDSGQILTINAYLCPAGYEGTDYSADCAEPIVGARFHVSSTTTLTTDDNGSVATDISDLTPGEVGITQEVDAQAGPRVSCVSDDQNLDVGFVTGSGASWAPIRFDVASKADVVCDLYYSDDLSFGVVNSASSTAGDDNGTVQLPDTGVGDGARRSFELPSALTWLVTSMGMAAGLLIRRRFAR